MKKLLLCTDLDRTLIPNGPQSESIRARKIFNKLTAREDVSLAYVTGRDKDLVLKAIDDYDLPLPDHVIADVGSTIYHIKGSQWYKNEQWESEISDDWNSKSNHDLQKLLEGYHKLRKQESSKQKQFKLSYYVPLHIDQVLLLKELNICLKNENINANLIWSVDEETGLGLLDILPSSANKKHAIEFLMELYEFKLDETIFVGDSGNDISVMASSIHSILVANASSEIKKAVYEQAKMNNECESIYVAQGDFFGLNGNYCAGIIEGVVHYMPVVKEWLGLDYE